MPTIEEIEKMLADSSPTPDAPAPRHR